MRLLSMNKGVTSSFVKFILLCLLFITGTAFVCLVFSSPGKYQLDIRVQDVNLKNKSSIKTTWPQYHRTPLSDWVPLPLSNVIGISDCIASGTVIKVSDSTFLFKIDQTIKGVKEQATITVLKAKADPFDSPQPAPYKEGQQYILFLAATSTGTEPKLWKLIDRGRADQMTFIDSWVYFNDRNFNGLTMGYYDVYGVKQDIQRFDKNMFLDAVQHYSDCFHWTKLQNGKTMPIKICDESKITRYANTSFMHKYLVNETLQIIASE
jgi:hypothetical protein